jgi:hypothetical protein
MGAQTQETIRKQLESLGQKMLVLSDGQPLPAAESTQPPEFTQQSLKPSSTWPEVRAHASRTQVNSTCTPEIGLISLYTNPVSCRF